MFNKVTIMGRLGTDPELRYTQGGTAVANLSVATTEKWQKDGEMQEKTEWHRVTVWNKQAENCQKYLTKGRVVLVEGKIQTRSWDKDDGTKAYATEIIASNVTFVPDGSGQRSEAQTHDQQAPTQNHQAPQAPANNQYTTPGVQYPIGGHQQAQAPQQTRTPPPQEGYYAPNQCPPAGQQPPAPQQDGSLDEIPF